MLINPIDWTAGPFLTLYVLLGLIIFVVFLYLQDNIGEKHIVNTPLNLLELAYLSGGIERVIDTVFVTLLNSNAATLNVDSKSIDLNDDHIIPPSIKNLIYELQDKVTISRPNFLYKNKDNLENIRIKLENLGFFPNNQQKLIYQSKVFILSIVIFSLGIIKLYVGVQRQKPVGILFILLFFTFFIVLRFLIPPQLTWAGKQALEANKKHHAREIRAPVGNELTLAVALTGLVVLSGTAYNAMYTAALSSSRGGGGDGVGGCSGGGDGGGGCGGGGCGGCGG